VSRSQLILYSCLCSRSNANGDSDQVGTSNEEDVNDEPLQSIDGADPLGNGSTNGAFDVPSTDADPAATLLARAGVVEEENLDASMVQWLSERGLTPENFDSEYGLLAPEDAVIIRPYGGEDDDILLQELRPRFVVLYEPNLAFIRRLEDSSPSLDYEYHRLIRHHRCTRTATQD